MAEFRPVLLLLLLVVPMLLLQRLPVEGRLLATPQLCASLHGQQNAVQLLLLLLQLCHTRLQLCHLVLQSIGRWHVWCQLGHNSNIS